MEAHTTHAMVTPIKSIMDARIGAAPYSTSIKRSKSLLTRSRIQIKLVKKYGYECTQYYRCERYYEHGYAECQ
jgi:hypothetical protein